MCTLIHFHQVVNEKGKGLSNNQGMFLTKVNMHQLKKKSHLFFIWLNAKSQCARTGEGGYSKHC